MKYEIGGRVRISGKWYDIVEPIWNQPSRVWAYSHLALMNKPDRFGMVYAFPAPEFIEDYDPPKKHWIEKSDFFDDDMRGLVNTILTTKYGTPPEQQ
jgi:hypothetical protein